jgi:hypothetical protein
VEALACFHKFTPAEAVVLRFPVAARSDDSGGDVVTGSELAVVK